MDKKGAYLILSNSDPKNENPNDNFFDELYEGFNINRVRANRMINCQADGRGYISELIITNY
jgi:DNA adenine methylase